MSLRSKIITGVMFCSLMFGANDRKSSEEFYTYQSHSKHQLSYLEKKKLQKIEDSIKELEKLVKKYEPEFKKIKEQKEYQKFVEGNYYSKRSCIDEDTVAENLILMEEEIRRKNQLDLSKLNKKELEDLILNLISSETNKNYLEIEHLFESKEIQHFKKEGYMCSAAVAIALEKFYEERKKDQKYKQSLLFQPHLDAWDFSYYLNQEGGVSIQCETYNQCKSREKRLNVILKRFRYEIKKIKTKEERIRFLKSFKKGLGSDYIDDHFQSLIKNDFNVPTIKINCKKRNYSCEDFASLEFPIIVGVWNEKSSYMKRALSLGTYTHVVLQMKDKDGDLKVCHNWGHMVDCMKAKDLYKLDDYHPVEIIIPKFQLEYLVKTKLNKELLSKK